MDQTAPRVALLWHGDREARRTASLEDSRFAAVAAALRDIGVEPEPAIYCDAFADDVRAQLKRVHGVLVWVNPIEHGHDRTVLDSLLREVADDGAVVSAHPDTILKMGTKEILYRTRDMSWGCDTRLYSTIDELREQLPLRLREGGARVLKQYRGNGGNGVWKVERRPTDAALVRARHALRGSPQQDVPLDAFLDQCAGYFAGAGRMIDQPYQERLTDGMVRCYMVGDEVAGFGWQEVNALYPAPAGTPPEEAPQPGPRLYHPPTAPEFQTVKGKMEQDWLPALCRTLELEADDLPLLWDADLLYGPRTASGEDTFVLCEINVSSVHPFPDAAVEPLARATKCRLMARRRQSRR